jgi:membrane-associated phospholipid phosphatase
VSGHSTFTGAGAEVLRRWFGRDDLAFSISSDTVPGVTRSYTSLTAVVEEIGRSRIWGGIHFLG